MIRFFQKLLRSLTGMEKRGELARPALLLSAPWLKDDRDNWSRFLQSASGIKLVQRLRAFEAANAISGCKDMFHTAHSAGRAMGYGECVEHFVSLSCSCDAQQEIAIGALGVAPADENKAQAEARQNRELLERLSP